MMPRRRTAACWPDVGLMVFAAALLLGLLALPLAAASGEACTPEEQQLLEAFQSGQIIRLHILADSNTPQAQCVKLHVRDRILEVFGRLLANAGAADADSLFAALAEHKAAMARVARMAAAETGFHGSVTVETGQLFLPQKRYGRVVLPAGQYRALRITLGSGQGRNWWCILYPQLCLALSEDSSAPGTALIWQTPQIFKQWLLFAPVG